LTITGGASSKDSVANTINSGVDKPKTTGIETFKITTTGSGTLDLSNTTGVKTVEATIGANDTLTIDKATDQIAKVKGVTTAGTVEYKLADATGSSDAVTFELDGAIVAGAKLKTTDIETVTVKISTNPEDMDLSDLSMTTAGATMKLVTTGTQALTVRGLNADVTTIDASGMGTGGSFVQTGRAATVASTYTGSDGNDTFQMKNSDDAIDAGAGTGDTLKVIKNLILGGIKVDLSQTGDQVTTFNGNSNTAVQTNFENVDLTSITGSFGSEITAIKGGSTIAGTPNVDVITLGDGKDLYSLTGLVSGAKQDDVTGFTAGTGTSHDDVGLDDNNTSDLTSVGSDAVAVVFASSDDTANDATLNLVASTASDAADIYILQGGNEAFADLSAATNGAELYKYLVATNTAGHEVGTNDSDGIAVTINTQFYLAAEDAGKTYIYHAVSGADTSLAKDDISLVATINATGLVAENFSIVA